MFSEIVNTLGIRAKQGDASARTSQDAILAMASMGGLRGFPKIIFGAMAKQIQAERDAEVATQQAEIADRQADLANYSYVASRGRRRLQYNPGTEPRGTMLGGDDMTQAALLAQSAPNLPQSTLLGA